MLVTRLARTALLAGCLVVSGCATSSTSSDEPKGGTSSGSAGGPITLRFQSLAFQEPTIKASKDIVASWNDAHPDVQVDYVQGSWDSVQDQLVTQFQGGTAPDIIHYESAAMAGFAGQGYLADLGPYLSDGVTSSVPQGVWDTVTVDGKVIAAPTLLQSYMVFANTDLLKKAGIAVPAGDTWSWDDFAAAAKATTTGDVHGVGWGLAEPTATMLSMGMNFGAKFFTGTGKDAQVKIGAAELALPERIHAMAYDDGSLDPTSLTQSGGDVMPAFLKGRYAMTVQGSYAAQTLVESAPKGFRWAVLPPLEGTSATQAANPQTLSVAAESPHVKEAAEFIDYYMQAENLAKVAEGDWLIPTSSAAVDVVRKDTGGDNGWEQVLDSGSHLTRAPFQSVTNYPQWKDQIATPAFQRYLADDIDADQLAKELTDGWSQVSG
jgi:ABC-type glycerol-3-phosphate transport system substrate-binding protein